MADQRYSTERIISDPDSNHYHLYPEAPSHRDHHDLHDLEAKASEVQEGKAQPRIADPKL